MLKIRVLPTLLYKNFGIVKGVGFDSWRHVGNLTQALRVYNMREVDELVFLDISATDEGRCPDFELVDDFADDCFMPLTVGGGIRSVDDVRRLLKVGADKVSINSLLVEGPKVVSEAAKRFGQQCIVASIDFRKMENGKHQVFTHSGKKNANADPVSMARRAEESGAGEILLCSIDRDGTMKGYVIEVIQQVCESVSIPVIASGGGGNFKHMYDAVSRGKASAVAASGLFQFTENTPLEAKRYLNNLGVPTRL